jgi:subtilisin family serine protease
MAGVLVAVLLLNGRADAQSAEDRKKIVLFVDGTPVEQQQALVELSGCEVVHTLAFINAVAVQLPLLGFAEAEAFLRQLPQVVGVFPDLVGVVPPITPLPSEDAPPGEIAEWGLERIGAVTAHQELPAWTGAGVTVAVLDTGVDLDHPDLRENLGPGFNAHPGGGSYTDDNGHGTHLAGIIAAARNGHGVVGVAPQARIAAVKVLDATGRGFLSDLLHGLQWVYIQEFPLVNMSLGFTADSPPLQQAIQRLAARGVLMVAAAGNCAVSSATTGDGGGAEEGGGDEGEGATTCEASQPGVRYPARYPEVLAVTATDYTNQVTAYSLTGLEVDVTAPGGGQGSERLLSTALGSSYGYGSGTSQAAAHVTGALALMLQQRPLLTFAQVLGLLAQTSGDLGYPETEQGMGLVAVEQMLTAPQ